MPLDCVELASELALDEEEAGLASPLDWDELAPEEAPELQAASKRVKIRAPIRSTRGFVGFRFVFVMAISSECRFGCRTVDAGTIVHALRRARVIDAVFFPQPCVVAR